MTFTFEIDIQGGTINGMDCEMHGPTAMRGLARALKDYLCKTGYQMTGLYNKGLYWPEEVQFIVEHALQKWYQIEPSQHLFDRLYEYRLPAGCYTAMLHGDVIEAELSHGKVTKVVTRLPNRRRQDEDMCAAIVLEQDDMGNNIAKVVTMWCNDHRDTHYTLKKENYVQGPCVVA